MNIVPVALGERSYTITIDHGLLPSLGQHIAPLLPQPRVVIVTDDHVAPLYLDVVQASLEAASIAFDAIILPAGESTKCFSQLESLLNQLLALGIDRSVTTLALGGGVIGDLAGFAASITLRGIPFIQVPTTVLAMVDSSVGGKTGINSQYGKNLVGAFYQPLAVIADLDVLETLPLRQQQAGFAEMVKYGVIDDLDFFATFEKTEKPMAITAETIAFSCACKARIVAEDETEKGKRALLNLGHTFGHALEVELGYDGRLLHGEAVAIGMVLALRYSAYLALCDQAEAERLEAVLNHAGLRTTLAQLQVDLDPQRIVNHMFLDKKVQQGKLVLILAAAIGASYIEHNVDAESVLAFMRTQCEER